MAKAQRSRGSGSGSGSEPDGASEEEDDAPVICGSDGIPFKILVVKHLARRRWGELLSSGRRFEDLDGDGLSDMMITRPLEQTDIDATAPARLDLYLSGDGR